MKYTTALVYLTLLCAPSAHAYLAPVKQPVREIATQSAEQPTHLRPADKAAVEHKIAAIKHSMAVLDRQLKEVNTRISRERAENENITKKAAQKLADEAKKRSEQLEKKLAYAKKRQHNLTHQRARMQAQIAQYTAQKKKNSL